MIQPLSLPNEIFTQSSLSNCGSLTLRNSYS
uniref:Uncharacterized protein n=1 Tax=Arundo donax TaxID=35708 RepID=A0A0A9E8M2_ARUDO